MKIDIDYPLLSKVFLEFITEARFKNAFQAFATEIYADIETASTNPNCSCRSKVENYVNLNRKKCADFLNNYLSENNINFDLEKINLKYQITNYAGKVEKVKISEWMEFRVKLMNKKATYRQFSTALIDQEHVYVFFL